MSSRLVILVLAVLLASHQALAATCSLLTSGSNATNATDYTTASVAPGSNRLLLLAISNVRNAATECANANVNSISGAGLTWVLVQEQCFSDAVIPTNNLALFRAMGPSPSSGTLSIGYVSTQTSAAWAVVECTEVDTSGTNGSGAVVQSVENSGNASTFSLTLSAFAKSDNISFAAFAANNNDNMTPKSGWTELSETQVVDGGLDYVLQTQVLHSADTSPSATPEAARDWAGIAIEIKSLLTDQGDIIWLP